MTYKANINTPIQYAGKDNPGLEDTMERHIANLVKLIEEKHLSSSTEFKPMDSSRKIQYPMLGTISNVGFGQAFGFLQADDDVFSYISTTETTVILFYSFSAPFNFNLLYVE